VAYPQKLWTTHPLRIIYLFLFLEKKFEPMKSQKLIALFLSIFTLFSLSVTQATAAEISGKVVGVHDGDTLTLLLP
jgi:endonuclease YncB( thermonuclease family)